MMNDLRLAPRIAFTPLETELNMDYAAGRRASHHKTGDHYMKDAGDPLKQELDGVRGEHAVWKLLGGIWEPVKPHGDGGEVDLLLPDNTTVQVKHSYYIPRGRFGCGPRGLKASVGIATMDVPEHPDQVQVIGWITREKFALINHEFEFAPGRRELVVYFHEMSPVHELMRRFGR